MRTANTAWVVTVLGVLIAASCAGTDRPDLPIGHFKITDGADGKINLEARCVALKDAVEAVAKHAGKTVAFEKPCNVFVTLWSSERQDTPEELARWLVISGGGSLCLNTDDSAWRVLTLAGGNDRYDPSLTEDEILANFSKRPVTPVPVSEGIKTGIFVYEGHYIPAPYQVNVREDGTGGFNVLLNSVSVRRYAFPPKVAPKEKTSLPPSGQFESGGALIDYVAETLYPRLLAEGLGKEEAIERVSKFVSTQKRVTEVDTDVRRDGTPSGLTMFFMDRETPVMAAVFPGNYDLDTGKPRSPSWPALSPESQATQYAESIEQSLDRGSLIIQSGPGTTIFCPSPDELHAALLSTKGLSLLKAECLVKECLSDSLAAREIVSGLRSCGDALITALNSKRSE